MSQNPSPNGHVCGECTRYRSKIEARRKEGGKYTDAVYCICSEHFFVLPDSEACKEIILDRNRTLHITR